GHNLGSLFRVRARTYCQVDIWCGHTELLEEYVRHVGVIVLSRVDERLCDAFASGQCAQNRRSLHKIWARTDDVKYSHKPPISLIWSLRSFLTSYLQTTTIHCLVTKRLTFTTNYRQR